MNSCLHNAPVNNHPRKTRIKRKTIKKQKESNLSVTETLARHPASCDAVCEERGDSNQSAGANGPFRRPAICRYTRQEAYPEGGTAEPDRYVNH